MCDKERKREGGRERGRESVCVCDRESMRVKERGRKIEIETGAERGGGGGGEYACGRGGDRGRVN